VSAVSDAYATALFQVAKAEGNLESVEDELFKVARTVESNEQLRATLTDIHLPVEQRQSIIEDLLERSRASRVTVALVSFVVGAGHGRELPAIIDSLVQRAAEERQEELAEVRSAIPLNDDQRQRLAEALSKATGKRVSVKVVVDPSILGGIVAQVGDTIIDGSVRHRLDQLKEAF
jgi:F-type H+-transporting ATPase subunit delta